MAKIGFKIWLLFILIGLSILSISPSFESGVVIKTVEHNSTAYNQGIQPGEIIKNINDKPITNLQDYSQILDEIFPTETRVKITITTNKNIYDLFIIQPPKIIVKDTPSTKIQTGLDLQGGARALVRPEKKLTLSEMNDLLAITNNRLNVFGISDVTVKSVRDLTGNYFMLVEIAGATPSDLEELVAKQGKFEAKIGNETVFIGEDKDVASVCRNDATCAGIYSCSPSEEVGYFCNYRFTVYLSEQAAKRHAEITSKLDVNASTGGKYLDKQLDFYVDNSLLDSLFISSSLKGQEATQISVQGGVIGSTQQEAYENSKKQMNKLQTILITGSLPYKLEIEKLDTISAVLGGKFISYLILAGIVALVAVALIIFFRYRNLKYSLAVLFILFAEIIIILGVASLIKWNLDLPSIAGILIVIGTGVDQLIIMLDESRLGRQGGLIEKLKRALFIIIGAYFTSLAALLPLYWAGAGLLKGFAVTTIIGITTGVLITRPAFAEILKKIET